MNICIDNEYGKYLGKLQQNRKKKNNTNIGLIYEKEWRRNATHSLSLQNYHS